MRCDVKVKEEYEGAHIDKGPHYQPDPTGGQNDENRQNCFVDAALHTLGLALW